MEAEFSDSEFSEILGALADVDDLLVGWDVLMTPLLDSEATELDGLSDQPKDYPQQHSITPFVVSHEADMLATRSLASNALPSDIVPTVSLSNVPASSHGVSFRAGEQDVPSLQLNCQRQQLQHLQGAHPESYPQFGQPTPAPAQEFPSHQLGTYAKPQDPPQNAGLNASGLHPGLSPPLLPQQQQVWPQGFCHQQEPLPHTIRAASGAILPHTVQTPSRNCDLPSQARPFSDDGTALAVSSSGAGDKYSISYNSTGAGAIISEYDSGSARLPSDLFAPPLPAPAGHPPTATAAVMVPAAGPAVRHSGVAVVTMGSSCTIVLPSSALPPTHPGPIAWTSTTGTAAGAEGAAHRASEQQRQALPWTGSVPGPDTSDFGLRTQPRTEATAGGQVGGSTRTPGWGMGPGVGRPGVGVGCEVVGPVGALGTAPLHPAEGDGTNGSAITSPPPGPSFMGALLAGLTPMAAASPGTSAPAALAEPGTALHPEQQPQQPPAALQQPQPQVPPEFLPPQLGQSRPMVGGSVQPSGLPPWQVAHGVGVTGSRTTTWTPTHGVGVTGSETTTWTPTHGVGAAGSRTTTWTPTHGVGAAGSETTTWTPTPAVATANTVNWPASDVELVGLGNPGTSLAAAAAVAAATASGGTVVTAVGGDGSGSGVSLLAPVSGASLLADLLAEATSGSWAALATALGPLPSGTGRTAEELLAGLDLSEVFAPPRTSHAKRIRGHVRRAAELKAQLADRVRAVQRLAAENADLRSRARVLELVVRCRDEQLQLLRSYRTSPDGKTFYVEQTWADGSGRCGRGPEAVKAEATALALEAGQGRRVPCSTVNLASLASLPASALLAVFRQLVSELSVSLAAVEAQESAIGSTAAAVAPSQDCQQGPQGQPAGAARVAGPSLALSAAHPPASAAPATAVTFATAGTPAVGMAVSAGVFEPCQHGAGAGAVPGGPIGVVATGAGSVPFGVAGDKGAAAVAIAAAAAAAEGTAAGLVGGGGSSLGAAAGAAATWGAPPPPLAQLRAQIAKFRSMVRYLGLVNDEVCRFVDTTLYGDTAPPDPGHWLRVVLALRLSGQQLEDAAALYACWQEWLGRIRAERRSIAAALDRLLSVNRYGNAYSESTGEYGTDRDAIHRIHANVMREKVLQVLVGEALCCHILMDIQWARAIVLSRPYVLDPRELLYAAAQLNHPYARRLVKPLPASGTPAWKAPPPP